VCRTAWPREITVRPFNPENHEVNVLIYGTGKNHKTRVNELERQLAEQSYNPIYSPNMIQGEMLRSLQRHYMQFGQMPFQGLDQQPGLRPLLPSHLNNPAHQETPKTLGNRADEMQDSGT
jgi:hypothetical protein